MTLPPAFPHRNQGSYSDSRLSSTLATMPRCAVGSSSCAHFAFVHMFGAFLPPWPTLPFATSECLKARCAHMFQHLLQHGDIQLHPKPFIVLGIDLWYTRLA